MEYYEKEPGYGTKYAKPDKIEPPKTLNNQIVCYWAEKEGILIGDQKAKVKKFLEKDCVRFTDEGWIVLPVPGNKTVHTVKDGRCTCQWNRMHGARCSHIMAVEAFEFKEKWNNEQIIPIFPIQLSDDEKKEMSSLQ